jgi:hypothetical protein
MHILSDRDSLNKIKSPYIFLPVHIGPLLLLLPLCIAWLVCGAVLADAWPDREVSDAMCGFKNSKRIKSNVPPKALLLQRFTEAPVGILEFVYLANKREERPTFAAKISSGS